MSFERDPVLPAIAISDHTLKLNAAYGIGLQIAALEESLAGINLVLRDLEPNTYEMPAAEPNSVIDFIKSSTRHDGTDYGEIEKIKGSTLSILGQLSVSGGQALAFVKRTIEYADTGYPKSRERLYLAALATNPVIHVNPRCLSIPATSRLYVGHNYKDSSEDTGPIDLPLSTLADIKHGRILDRSTKGTSLFIGNAAVLALLEQWAGLQPMAMVGSTRSIEVVYNFISEHNLMGAGEWDHLAEIAVTSCATIQARLDAPNEQSQGSTTNINVRRGPITTEQLLNGAFYGNEHRNLNSWQKASDFAQALTSVRMQK